MIGCSLDRAKWRNINAPAAQVNYAHEMGRYKVTCMSTKRPVFTKKSITFAKFA